MRSGIEKFDFGIWLKGRIESDPEESEMEWMGMGELGDGCRQLLNLVAGSRRKSVVYSFLGKNWGLFERNRMNGAFIAIKSSVHCQHKSKRIWTKV